MPLHATCDPLGQWQHPISTHLPCCICLAHRLWHATTKNVRADHAGPMTCGLPSQLHASMNLYMPQILASKCMATG